MKTTTRTRVDVGLRLSGQEPGGRLLAAGRLGNGSCTVRLALYSATDVDDEVSQWLRRAYAAAELAKLRLDPSAGPRRARNAQGRPADCRP